MIDRGPWRWTECPTNVWAQGTLFSAAASLLLTVGGCGVESAPDELVLAGRVEPLINLLDACSLTADSAVARACSDLAEAVRPCTAVVAACSISSQEGESCDLADQVRCVEVENLDAFGIGAGEGWLLRGPLPADTGHGGFELYGQRGSRGEHTLRARIEGVSADAGWGRWLPSDEQTGGFRLANGSAFAHARWRPAGGVLPEGDRPESIADRLYGLRAKLFSAAVLTGDVELVLFVPGEGDLFPGVAAALDFRLQGPAVAAMKEYIDSLQEQWPLSRSHYRYGAWRGECLGNLKVLPGLAPCYVTTDESIVVAWNRESLEAALGSVSDHIGGGGTTADGRFGGESGEKGVVGSRLEVDFEQLLLADRRLADARKRGVAFYYPFSSLEVRGGREGEAFVVEATLQPGDAP